MRSSICKRHRQPARVAGYTPLGWTILLTLAWLILAGPAGAQSGSKTFVVVGKSRIQEAGINAAKDTAIAECKRIAVEHMTAELLALETLVMQFPAVDTVVFSQADKFIQFYKVLNEHRTDDAYRVLVQAKVSGQMIEARLRAAGLQSAETRPATRLDLIVVGSDNLSSFVLFRSRLNEMAGVEEVQISEILPNRTTLSVDYRGTPGDFAEALLREPQEAFRFRVFQESENNFRIDLAPSAAAQEQE